MPASHREWAEANPTKVIAWAESIGPRTAGYVRKLIDMRPAGLRSVLGLTRVAAGHERVEGACEHALRLRRPLVSTSRAHPQARPALRTRDLENSSPPPERARPLLLPLTLL